MTIGNSVTEIGTSAFSGCSGLKTVNFNAKICRSMGELSYPVFKDCNSLETLNIGNEVIEIPKYAFSKCIGLTSVTIPNSVTEIEYHAFNGCENLEELIIEDGEERLSLIMYKDLPLLFKDCPLKKIYLGRNLYCEEACSSCSPFYEINTLEKLVIGNSVTWIDDYAFYGCSGLTSVTIPNSVTEIGKYAFYGCGGLTSVTIGNSVTQIRNHAFANSNILDITVLATVPPTLDSSYPVFDSSTLNNGVLHTLKDCDKTYKTSSRWKDFKNIVDDAETRKTAIVNIKESRSEKYEVFDLQGRRLSSPQRGINIINGKRVLVK